MQTETTNCGHRRVAVFIPSMAGAGAQRVTLTLMQEIVARGYPLDLLLARAEGTFLQEVPPAVRIIDLKTERARASLLPLLRYLRRERPAALLSVMYYANIVSSCACRLAASGTRLVLTEHSVQSQKPWSKWRRRAVSTLIRWTYRWADEIVAVSGGVASDLSTFARIRPDRTSVIYNPVLSPELNEKASSTLSHPWFEVDQPPVVLAVGRLNDLKDFATLIRAFARVRRLRAARLLILGEGPERANLEELIRDLRLDDDVALPGFQSNPYAFMARSAVFVLSSRFEGLPTVLIEAMGCGTTIVATDCPGGTREILADGTYGRLVPVGDEVSLAQAVEEALDGKVKSAPSESCIPYQRETVVDQYLAILLGDKQCAS